MVSRFQAKRQPGGKSNAHSRNILVRLKGQLNLSVPPSSHSILIILQGLTVQGKVNLTCDAWQASNADGYFAIMAYWIEKPTLTKWKLKSVLIGFMWVNNAHSGKWLG